MKIDGPFWSEREPRLEGVVGRRKNHIREKKSRFFRSYLGRVWQESPVGT